MPLTVELRDERSSVVERVLDDGTIRTVLAHVGDERSPCLRWIDAYGDTMFNGMQARALAGELREHDGAVISQVLDLAERCADGVHLYLWFLGD